MDETKELAKLVTETTYNDIEEKAVQHAKKSIRDFIGVAIYGSQHEIGSTLMNYLDSFGEGNTSTIIGHDSMDPMKAALANGVFGHAIDYDDTFSSVVIHPSGSTFPSALAASEFTESTGQDLLTAYVVGLEVIFRVGHSLAPTHWGNGWHTTGTVGVFGATAAAASILDLSLEETRKALGIAGSCSSGIKKNSGTMTKPLHPGNAAQMGLRAAFLAQAGFTGDSNILEGKYGYGNVMTLDSYNPEKIIDPPIDSWAVLDNGFKPYPSGVVTHAPMEALRNILVKEELESNDVEKVTIGVDKRVSDRIDQYNPQTSLQAKFSYEFCLAAILREKTAGVNEFTDEYVVSDETRKQMEKIERNHIKNIFGGRDAGEASYGAKVTVKTFTGAEFTDEVREAPGSPANPISDERLKSKYYNCAETVFTRSEAKEIEEGISRLDSYQSISEFTEHFSSSNHNPQ